MTPDDLDAFGGLSPERLSDFDAWVRPRVTDGAKALSVPSMPVWGAAFLEGLRQLPTAVDGPPCEGA